MSGASRWLDAFDGMSWKPTKPASSVTNRPFFKMLPSCARCDTPRNGCDTLPHPVLRRETKVGLPGDLHGFGRGRVSCVAMSRHNPSRMLWVLLGLFTARVVAQPMAAVSGATWLPPFDAFQSGAVPYWLLL